MMEMTVKNKRALKKIVIGCFINQLFYCVGYTMVSCLFHFRDRENIAPHIFLSLLVFVCFFCVDLLGSIFFAIKEGTID